MSTIITNLRGARVTPIHRGSVLLSKQEDLCSTSFKGQHLFGFQLARGAPVSLFRATGVSSTSHVEPAVNRQPGFRRELVEQITSFIVNS